MDESKCTLCGSEHIEVIERLARLESQGNADRVALGKAEALAADQYRHLNDLRKEVVVDRMILVSRETYDVQHGELARQVKDLRDEVGDLGTRVSKWETRIVVMAAGAILIMGAITLTLKISGH